ncbi:MAG TPA: hypothetical protein VIH59_29320 [Candidatus Tectomicrobia bacterium]|jgi:hypothetical protein
MTNRVIRLCGMALCVIVGVVTPGRWIDAPPEMRPGQAWAQAPGDTEAPVIESLGDALAVDVYLLQCAGPALCATADVADEGPFKDTRLSVCLTGAQGVAGKSRCRLSPQGGLSTPVKVCRTTPGPLTVYMVIANVDQTGPESYSSALACTGEGSTLTVQLLLDQ